MKLLKKGISEKNAQGFIIVIPEHTEDLWHLYHIIQAGDQVRAFTTRYTHILIHTFIYTYIHIYI